LQPNLLRVLEAKEIRKVGGTGTQRVDVRVVAATNRDLRAEVNSARFRSDLYFRLAVVKIAIPPLRERPEDIPLLVEQLFRRAGVPADGAKMLRTPQFLGMLMGAAWPGNVRELRNYLERCLVLEEVVPVDDAVAASTAAAPAGSTPEALPIDAKLPYAEARRRALDDFERRYATALLALHQGKVTAAAQAAGIDRVYLHRLLRRHGIR
jgi:DNA-binding NtrC family response regulator